MEKTSIKKAIQICICNILVRENKEYARLSDIYNEVSNFLEVENNTALQSQIRGRLQECCEQYSSFTGEDLFLTEKIRSGKWKVKINNKKNVKNTKKYIRYIKNTYLISNDNWDNIEIVKNINDEYQLEEDLDIVYKVKLTQLIGKEKSMIIISELNNIRKLLKELKNIYNTHRHTTE